MSKYVGKPFFYEGVPVNCGNVKRFYLDCRAFQDKVYWDMMSGSEHWELPPEVREMATKRILGSCNRLRKMARRCAKGRKG